MSDDIKANPAATLTEQQLFANFIRMPIQYRNRIGSTEHTCQPEDLLRDGGQWGELADFTELFTDDLKTHDTPESELGCLVESLECYLDGLNTVLTDFRAYKAIQSATPQEAA
ncbi:hypothetical protein ACLIR7_07270 [Nitratireductor aquimarinus]|uniref:hypothetical protein n=1 Tax=Nitratireductor aquimarinus TaxID=889300 RepID=UPI00398E5102